MASGRAVPRIRPADAVHGQPGERSLGLPEGGRPARPAGSRPRLRQRLHHHRGHEGGHCGIHPRGLLVWALHAGALRYGGWELVAAGAACIVFAWFYTAGPYPLAYHGLGDAAVILFFGLVPVGFTYYIQTGAWTPEVLVAALACGLVIDTMLMINNFRDREEDARCNKRTIVVCLGAGVGRWGYLALGTAAVALCLTLLFAGRTWAALLPLPYLAAHISTWRKMVRIDHGDALNVCLGETARNILLFGALFTLGILLGR